MKYGAVFLVIGLPFLAKAQTIEEVNVGVRIFGTYRALLNAPRRDSEVSKAVHIENEIYDLRQRIKVTSDDVTDLAPRYIALSALQLEFGGSWAAGGTPIEKAIQKRYGPEIRRRWSPEVQKLWLEAFFVPQKNKALAQSVRQEVDRLRNQGVNVDAFLARTLALGLKGPDSIEKSAELCLDFAEKTPADIVASLQASLFIDSLVFDAVQAKRPLSPALSTQVNRVLALESRTLANLNRLLNDRASGLGRFASLRKRLRQLK